MGMAVGLTCMGANFRCDKWCHTALHLQAHEDAAGEEQADEEPAKDEL